MEIPDQSYLESLPKVIYSTAHINNHQESGPYGCFFFFYQEENRRASLGKCDIQNLITTEMFDSEQFLIYLEINS